jgi:hypothetical protein
MDADIVVVRDRVDHVEPDVRDRLQKLPLVFEKGFGADDFVSAFKFSEASGAISSSAAMASRWFQTRSNHWSPTSTEGRGCFMMTRSHIIFVG